MRLAVLVASLLLLGPVLTAAAPDPFLDQVATASKKALHQIYKNHDYKAIIVDNAVRTATGAEVEGRILWRDGCPRENRWHFFFDQAGVIDDRRSTINRSEAIRRCYEESIGRSVPPSTADGDAFIRTAKATCETAVRGEIRVAVQRVWTDKVLRFQDGGVNLSGYLETATVNFGWVCKVGPDGRIRSSGKDVMVLPRGTVGSVR